MDRKELRKLIGAHLEKRERECRWCFAIDKVRVDGDIIGQYDFSDAMLLHLRCPRCDGEFTCYAKIFGRDYIEERVRKLHPETKGVISEEWLEEIVDLVFPEDSGIWNEPAHAD